MADDYGSYVGAPNLGSIAIGGSANGNIEVGLDHDWFAVSLSAGTSYIFQQNAGTLGDPRLTLRDSNGVIVTGNDDVSPGNPNSEIRFTATISGTYYLDANSADGADTGTYTVTAAIDPAPPQSNDDYASQLGSAHLGSVAIGGSSAGTLETGGDHDWFAVTLSAGTSYVFQQNAGTLGDPRLSLRDSNGVIVTGNDDVTPGNPNSEIRFTATVSGTYYLDANSADGSDTGTYTVTAAVDGAPPPPANDDYGSQLGAANLGSVAIGGSSSGTLETGGDHDWFAVTLKAGDSYVFRLDAGTLGDPRLALLGSNGVSIVGNDDVSPGNPNSQISFTATTSGTYYLDANSSDGSDTGTYTVSATLTYGAPTVETNAVSTVAEGGLDTISTAELRTTDSDTAAGSLVYTLDSAPANGVLFVDADLDGVVDAGETRSSGGTFTQADIDAGRVKYLHDGSETTSDSFHFHVSDGTTTVNGQTFTFSVTPVNDPPTLTATPATASYTENGSPVDLFSNVSISTVESGQKITAVKFYVFGMRDGASETITVDGTTIALTGVRSSTTADHGLKYVSFSDGENGFVQLSSDDGVSASLIESIIDGLTYANLSDNPTAGTRTIRLAEISDNGGAENGGSPNSPLQIDASVDVLPVNDAPTLDLDASAAGTGYEATYTENGTPRAIADTDAVIADVDSATVASATVTLTNHQTGDILAVNGNLPGGIVASSYDATTGVLTLTGSASASAYQTALHQIVFSNTTDDPSGTDRTITVTVNDGSLDSPTATATIHVTPVNDPPMLTATPATASYTENGSPVDLFSNVSISTVESGQTITRVTFTLLGLQDGASETLTIDGTTIALAGTSSSTTAGHGLTYYVNGGQSLELYSASGVSASLMANIVDGITYANLSDNPTAGARTIGLSAIFDNGGEANGGYDHAFPELDATVTVVPVNDAPTLDLDASAAGTGYETTYTENGTPQAIADTDIAIADVDTATVSSATITLTNHQTGDILAVNGNLPNGIVASFYDPTIGVLTLTGSASASDYQTALHQIVFSNVTDDPSGTDRTITVTVNDGSLDSATATTTIHLTPVNDAPTLTATPATASYIENGSPVDLFSDVSVSTVDSGQTITKVMFIVDGIHDGASETITIDGTTIALTGSATSTTADNGLTYKISVGGGVGILELGSADGVSASVMASIIDGITYADIGDNPTPGTRTIRLDRVDDNGGTANAGVDHYFPNITASVDVVPVNDAPTLTADGVTNATYTEGGDATDLFSNVVVSTVEDGQYVTSLTLTVSGVSDGASEALVIDGASIALNNGNAGNTANTFYSITVSAGVATVTLTSGLGAAAATVQGIIDGFAYQNTSINPTGGTRTITLTSIQDSGGTANGGQDTTTVSVGATVNVVPVNQDPTAHDDVLAIAQRATAYGNVLTNDTDPESDTLSVTGFSHGLAIAAPGGSILGEHGTLTVNANGSYRYVAGVEGAIAVGATATDLFDYAISDGHGGVDTAHLTVTVTGSSTGTAGANTFLMTGPGTYAAGLGGDDTYIVDSQTDVVYEKVGGGDDTVKTSVSYALGSAGEVEHLQTTNALGTAAINLIGNKFDNEITGNAGDNLLNGGGGADTLIGGGGNDRYIVDASSVVIEQANGGIDTVYATTSYALSDNVENIRAYGALADLGVTLTGNTLANALYGGAGADTLVGGDGNDKYFVSTGDTVVEASGQGTDSVYTNVSFTLADNVEQLYAYNNGSTGLRLTGNGDANLIMGGAGADTIIGGAGTDKLYGGAGNDTFRFENLADGALGSYDRIYDFEIGHDKIDLRGVQAVTGAATDQAFSYIGESAFTKVAGQLHISFIGTTTTLIEGDVNGDAKADFRIALIGHYDLSGTDFML